MQIDSYVSERKKKRKKRHGYFVFVVIFLIAYFFLLGVGWLVFRSPLFRVEHTVIQGNNNVGQNDIISLVQAGILNGESSVRGPRDFIKSLLGSKNILVWPSTLPSSSLMLIPELASIDITKDYWSRTVTITATERQPFAIWCLMAESGQHGAGSIVGGEQCFWFDDQGVIFSKAFDTQGSAIFAIHDYSQSHLALNAPVLPDQFAHNLISVVKTLIESHLPIQDITLKNLELQEIDVTTHSGPAVYFSLRFPADEDLPVLESLMSKPGFNKLQYVDFRVEHRAYYK